MGTVVFGAGAAVRAQGPLASPAPLTRAAAPIGEARTITTLLAAQRAHDFGLPALAVDQYRELLEAPGTDRVAVGLALATALLDAGRAAEVEPVLAAIPEPRGAAWRLRMGLATLQLRRRAEAQAQWDAIVAEEVADVDRAWYWFLTGALYDTATPRDSTRANQFYLNAEAAAKTEMARARFQLAGEQVRLRLGRPTDAALRQQRQTAEQFSGQALGYEAARHLAVMLAESDRRAEAIETLERTIRAAPARERAAIDELRFMLGLLGDRGRGGAGRNALAQLLENGSKTERQRQALQLLAEASREEPARKLFRDDLDRLIAGRPPHPILESLLYYRAQLALADKDFARAEEDAAALLKQFPLSALRVHALGVLAESAWEQKRYRLAADYAGKTRADLAVLSGGTGGRAVMSARAGFELGVLAAEASFRAGDFRNAADAYALVLRERPADLEAPRVSEMMFMRVLAEIQTGSGDAAKVLDELERDPAFDLESRWQAEWSLARALQVRGEAGVKEAFARISALLREPIGETAAPRPDLRARVAWLQAWLSFENGLPEQTIALVEALMGSALAIDAQLKSEIVSSAMLFRARAEFGLRREAAGLETLAKLRSEHPTSDAAASSYLIEAEHYAGQDKIAEARSSLIKLADSEVHKGSERVPEALFRLALLAERLGGEEHLREANKRIEDLMALSTRTPTVDHALVFAARLRQGDIYRKRGDFPGAQRAYEYLINTYPQRPDVVYAYLALADCHRVQSSTDTDLAQPHTDAARSILEQLRDRLDAPRDVRVEAGYKLGALLLGRGKQEEAAKVWWQDVVNPFLIDETKPTEGGAKRPYWLARTLLDLGELLDKREGLEDAKAAYLLLLEKGLPFGDVARARLQQMGVTPTNAAP